MSLEENLEPESSLDTKECPFCAEIIKKNAKVCRFCKSDLEARGSSGLKTSADSIDTSVKRAYLQNLRNDQIGSMGPKFVLIAAAVGAITIAVTGLFSRLFIESLWADVFLILYFAPALIAALRKKRNTLSIFALNFMLGCTIFGWIVSMIWALSAENPT